jgi:TM2 domain-containing membrane protein YozV
MLHLGVRLTLPTEHATVNRRAYTMQLYEIVASFPDTRRRDFLTTFLDQEKSPVVGFGLALYLGTFGVDRFYRGQVALGFLKMITLGGLGIWTITDWFIAARAVRDDNIVRALNLKAMMQSVG